MPAPLSSALSLLCKSLTFPDGCCWRHPRVAGPAARRHADDGEADLRGRQEGRRPRGGGGVAEQRGAVAGPPAFPPVAIDCSLKLSRRTEGFLLAFVGIEVLHVPGERGAQGNSIGHGIIQEGFQTEVFHSSGVFVCIS